MALDALKKEHFKSQRAAASACDISETTLRRRIGVAVSRPQKTANCQKLSATEESTLSAWILDMDKCGLPLQLSIVRHLAQLLVSACLPSITIGENWVNCYVKRHPELRSKYTRKYHYQHAKREDSGLFKSWFMRVQETIQNYGVLIADICNMDEAGFQMGVTSTANVICGLETKQSHAKWE